MGAMQTSPKCKLACKWAKQTCGKVGMCRSIRVHALRGGLTWERKNQPGWMQACLGLACLAETGPDKDMFGPNPETCYRPAKIAVLGLKFGPKGPNTKNNTE